MYPAPNSSKSRISPARLDPRLQPRNVRNSTLRNYRGTQTFIHVYTDTTVNNEHAFEALRKQTGSQRRKVLDATET
jgi:hypothetical protein